MKHTVEHLTLNNPHDYQCRKYLWWCMEGCGRYLKGECKPNYPVPAIRYEIVIAKTIVAIFNENNRYLPEYIYC